jgi:hypothetical protein
MVWQGTSWQGVAWSGTAGAVRAPARWRSRAAANGPETVQGGARVGQVGRGWARQGKAGRGRARVVTKRLRLVVGYIKGAIRRRGVETVDPADHLAQASRPMGGTLARRTAKSERLTKRPVPDYLRRAHTFI